MKRTARLASLALVGALALAACGNDSDDTKAGSGDPAGGSSQTTEAADLSAGDEVDVDTFVDQLSEGLAATGTAHMTMEMKAQGQTITGEGDVSYEDGSRADFTMEMGGLGTMHVIMLDKVMYMNVGQMGDTYVKIDLDDPDGPLGDQSAMLESMDPVAQLQQLKAGITGVTFAGEETVQGESMSRYTVTIDPAEVEQFAGEPGVAELGELEYDIWLDGEHRMRQMEMTLPGQGGGTVRTEITDLGKDVDIQAPPADKVTDATDM